MTVTDKAPALTRSEQYRNVLRNVAPIGVLLLLVFGITMFERNFLSWDSFRALLEQWPLIFALTTGQMLVIMTGRIDLSIASLTSLAAMITVWGLENLGGPLTVLAVLGMTTVIGLAQGLLHYHAQVASFVITLGGLGAWSGLALALFGGSSLIDRTGTLEWLYDRFELFGYDIPWVTVLAILMAVAVGLAMRYLPIGRQILAVGNGQLSAAYSGIKVDRVLAAVFAASGFFAGIGGIMIVGWIDAASPRTADNLLLPCIAAVIVGGTAITGGLGSIGRSVTGAMIMAVLRVGMDVAGIEAKFQPIIFGALIIIAVSATIDRSRLAVVK